MTEFASQAVEEELQRILKVSGIESSPIDPSSMEFLRQLVQDRNQKKKSSTNHPNYENWENSERNSTSATTSLPSSAPAVTNRPTKTTLSNADAAMILEQLKLQTNLILSLQDKIQVLAERVNQMDRNGNVTSSNRVDEPQSQRQEEEADAREVHVIPPPQEENAPEVPRQDNSNRAAVVGPQPLQQPGVFSWFFQTIRLFWVLSRGYVRPIDGPLLFKLVFMTMVVMARFNKRASKRNNSKNKDSKILLVSGVLMMGFLFHTRYIQYVYQFLWKQNVPGRVWKGEQNITIPPPEEDDRRDDWNNNNNNNEPPRHRNPVPPRLRREQQEENERPVHWWHQNDLLVGGVAPIQDAPAVNPVIAVVQGIYYLVGSFVFSIFPMWNPQGHQQRRPLRQERLDRDEIPQVQAPRDALEAADDDDGEGEQQND